jgi:hypothetical protein
MFGENYYIEEMADKAVNTGAVHYFVNLCLFF